MFSVQALTTKPQQTPPGERGNRQWPCVPGLSRAALLKLGARPCSSTGLGHAHVCSHRAAVGLYPPTAASHQAPRTPRAPASPKVQGSLLAPSLHQQSTAGQGREEEWEREKLRGCRVGPESAKIQKRQARTGVNRQEEGG